MNWITVVMAGLSPLLFTSLNGQDRPAPISTLINQPCPDFQLNQVDYYDKPTAALQDFGGKPLILDFWTTGCVSCVESFPKLSALQETFGNQMQILLIGVDFLRDTQHKIAKKTFNRYREKYQLNLPVAYDSNLFKLFNVPSVPYVVWIDKNGVVRGTSSSDQLNARNITALINLNEAGQLNLITPPVPKSYDYHLPLLVNHNGGADSVFLFRSLLTRYEPGYPQFAQTFISSTVKSFGFVRPNRVQATGVSLSELYDLAYGDTINRNPSLYAGNPEVSRDLLNSAYGKWWRWPVLELQDSTAFISPPASFENKFNYSCIVPANIASTGLLQSMMQADLAHYFGYTVTLEKRIMPCWKITADAQTKDRIRSKGGPPGASSTPAGMRIVNLPLYSLVRLIFEYHDREPPFIDDTGIEGSIDLQVEAVMTSLEDIRQQLRTKGFHLEKGKKEMKVIVIRDKK